MNPLSQYTVVILAAFTIYADRKLQTPELLVQIVRRFGLAKQHFVVGSEAHYRTGI